MTQRNYETAVDKECHKLEHLPARDVRDKADVSREAQAKASVHLTMIDYCHLEHSELTAHATGYKGRVVLPGDTVKQDLLNKERPRLTCQQQQFWTRYLIQERLQKRTIQFRAHMSK